MYILNTASKSKQELYTFGLFLIVTIEDDNITMQSSIMHYTTKYGNNFNTMCSYRLMQITAEKLHHHQCSNSSTLKNEFYSLSLLTAFQTCSLVYLDGTCILLYDLAKIPAFRVMGKYYCTYICGRIRL